MSKLDYAKAIELYHQDYSFDSLIMAAALKADSSNLRILFDVFPEQTNEAAGRFSGEIY